MLLRMGSPRRVHAALYAPLARSLDFRLRYSLRYQQDIRSFGQLAEDFERSPIPQDGRPQPLTALIAISMPVRADKLINPANEGPCLLQSVRTRWIVRELGITRAEQFFDNINTPQDYEQASGKGDPIQVRG